MIEVLVIISGLWFADNSSLQTLPNEQQRAGATWH